MSAKEKETIVIGQDPIYDATKLGAPRMTLLGFQHMFAMFGATVLVPLLTGLSVSTTLLFAGVGTILFYFIAKRSVPAFLGSSFAFIAGYAAVAGQGETLNPDLLPYACIGVFFAGALYLVLAALCKAFGASRVMRFFPPVVTGPIVISIGLILASSAVNNCTANWWIALVAVAVIVVCNIFGKGMIKVIPILIGVIVSYFVAAVLGLCDFTAVNEAAWFGIPIEWDCTVFGILGDNFQSGIALSAILTIAPISFATMIEHIGDISAISSTTGKNFIANPGLQRTLTGDGLATMLAALFGAPANTTYGENTGVLALTKVYDPRVIVMAACFAIVFSFCPKFAQIIYAMPTATIGGVSLVLYGMISAVGIRNLVENHTDFTNTRNVLVVALIIVLSVGIAYSTAGALYFSESFSLSGLAVGSIAGIILNAILPGKDYVFVEDADVNVPLEIGTVELPAKEKSQASLAAEDEVEKPAEKPVE